MTNTQPARNIRLQFRFPVKQISEAEVEVQVPYGNVPIFTADFINPLSESEIRKLEEVVLFEMAMPIR